MIILFLGILGGVFICAWWGFDVAFVALVFRLHSNTLPSVVRHHSRLSRIAPSSLSLSLSPKTTGGYRYVGAGATGFESFVGTLFIVSPVCMFASSALYFVGRKPEEDAF